MKRLFIILASIITILTSCKKEELAPIEVENVILSITEDFEMTVGDSKSLTASVLPENAEDKSIKWASSDPSIITVKEGKVEAIAAGKAKISATSNNRKTSSVTITVKNAVVKVTKIELDNSSLSFIEGSTETQNLVATVSPENATNKNISWTSSDEDVAKVADGVVCITATAKYGDVATIIVTTEDGGKVASCTINILQKVIDVENISLNKSSLSLLKGEEETLNYTINPDNATNKDVEWSTSDEDVATVSSSGIVMAKANGTATITVTSEDGNKSDECLVTVTTPVESVSLDLEDLAIFRGETKKLTATVSPEDASNQAVDWSSSDNDIVSVDSEGNVTAKADGEATITATTEDGAKTATCDVVVTTRVESVIISPSEDLDLNIADTKQLTATVTPEGAAEVVWSSDNEEVATVTESGLVVARKVGTAIIKATANNKIAELKVRVSVPVATAIKFDNDDDITLIVNNTKTIIVVPTPSSASLEGLTWESSAPEVASVIDGIITAKAEGEANITARLEALSVSVKVTVVATTKEWLLEDFSDTNYPSEDTWTIHNSNHQDFWNKKTSGLRNALKDVKKKRPEATINLVFPKATQIINIEMIESLSYDYPKLSFSAPIATELFGNSIIGSPCLISFSAPKAMVVTTDIFRFSPNLLAENITLNPKYFAIEDGVIYDDIKSKIIYYLSSNTKESYVAPSTVECVEYNAFVNNKHLKTVEIAEATLVEYNAFYNCKITTLILPKVIKIMGNYTFDKTNISSKFELASKVRYNGSMGWSTIMNTSEIVLTTNSANADGFKMTSSNGERSEDFNAIITVE